MRQLRTIAGGAFAGDLADGVIKPNLPADYAPSGMWDGMSARQVPDTGDPDLREEADRRVRCSRCRRSRTSTRKTPDQRQGGGLAAGVAGQGRHQGQAEPDRGRASTTRSSSTRPRQETIAGAAGARTGRTPRRSSRELFTPAGGFNLSQADDKAFNAKVDAAKGETDRTKQAERGRRSTRRPWQNAWVIPTRFGREQRLAGSKVQSASGDGGEVYIWAPYGSWPYGDMYVTK